MYDLYDAVMAVKNRSEFEDFMSDLMSKVEIKRIRRRWEIAQMLYRRDTQREIAKEINTGINTVSQIARNIKPDAGKGFVAVIQKLQAGGKPNRRK